MIQSLQDFLKTKSTTQTGLTKIKSITPLDVVKEVPVSTGITLRWIGKQLMKPIGVVAKTSEAIGKAIGGETTALKTLPKEAGKILTGEKEYSFSQLWKENLPDHPLAATIIGLTIDIAADPLNFIGGITTKGLSLAEKGLQKVPVIQKGLKPMFSTKTGVKAVDTLIDQYKSLGEYRKVQIIEGARNVQKTVSKLKKNEIIEVSNFIEKGIKSKNPVINKLGEELNNTYKLFKELEQKVGVKGGELAQYAPHIKVKVPLSTSIKNFISPTKQWSAKLGAGKERTILKFVSKEGDELIGKMETLGLKETSKGIVNKSGKVFEPFQASIDEISQAFGKVFFEENPAIQMAYRGLSSAKAVTSKEFFTAIKKFATKDGVIVNIPELKGLKFSEDVARQVDNYYKGIQPEELKIIAKTFDTVQNWWKGQALIAPSYHIRNMVGNIWNNFLAGVKNPIDYIQAGMLQSGKGKDLIIAGKSADEILELAAKRGVLNQGWYAADIPTMVESGIKSTWKQGINPLSQQNYGFKLNQAVGSAFENNARLAHFINKLKGGSTIDDAVMSVKKYLFDYQDLTNFEKTFLKRIMPFYTWSRKNIPLQLENLIKQPGKYAGLEKAIKAVENIAMGNAKPANEKYLSDYIKNNTAMRVGYDEKNKTYSYFLLGNWMPSYQAFDFLSQPLYNIMAMVTPLIKTPMEVLMNRSTFFKNTLGESSLIEREMGDTVNYLGYSMSPKVATVLRNIRLLNELDKLNPGKIFGGEKGEPSKMPKIGGLIPSVEKYTKYTPTPSQGERISGLLLGKLQQYKESAAKNVFNWETENRIKEYETAILQAQKAREKEKAKKLQQELKEFRIKRKQ